MLTGFRLDEFFRRTDSTGSRDFLTDALGSVLALTDSAGMVQTSYTYEPFGNTAVSGATNGNPHQYTGRENDGTGVYYYRARYYNPQLQRFISSDPIGLEGGLNTYTYVLNNPLRFTDPSGLVVCPPDSFIVDDPRSPGAVQCVPRNPDAPPSGHSRCVTAECAADVLPNPPTKPPTACEVQCMALAEAACSRVQGFGKGLICSAINEYICRKMSCDDDKDKQCKK